MLQIEDQKYYDEVREKATQLGLRDELDKELEYLGHYAERGGKVTRCRLWKDWAPLSFYFVMECKDITGEFTRWFNGGLIYYGPEDPGDGGAPQFSVDLNRCCNGERKAGWSVHT